MSGLRLARISAAAMAVAVFLAGQAWGDGGHVGTGGPPKAQLSRLAEQQKRLNSLDNSDAARSLYSQLMVWPPSYAKLRVCFFGGSPETNAAIAKVAGEWITRDVGLKLDFGNEHKPRKCSAGTRENQIRISYDAPGYWSHTGQNAVVLAGQNEPSLNLEGFDRMEPAKLGQGNERAIILHSFGHALGLLHEQLLANGRCQEEFDWKYIEAQGSGLDGPLTWIIPIPAIIMQSGPDLVASEFDAKSVMLEPYPEKFFVKGAASPCFIKQYNRDVSAGDHAAMAGLYPAKGAKRAEAFRKKKAAFQEIADKAGKSKRQAARDVMRAYFGGK
ncbi:hypothetical protein [Taklimakanibacter lacteus]|uniref:hypothetical protein n=1 Tax=Taklimakanibacter lacteus TaxID=2268456 RepID=UPI0013C44C88